jgi:hypothetical protein
MKYLESAQEVDSDKCKKNKAKIDRSERRSVADSNAVDELIAPLTWGHRLKRVFNIDITVCPLRGGSMRVIADIIDPDIIQKILDHIEPRPPPLKPATTIHS